MIRLVACDMDGTLLNSRKELPSETGNYIDYFKRNDILFVIASGRQLASLEMTFSDKKNDICFICENGSFISLEGRYYPESHRNYTDYLKVIRILNAYEVSIIFSTGLKASIISNYYDQHKQIIDLFYPSHEHVATLDSREDIVEVGIYDPTGNLPVADILASFSGRYNIVKSEERWFNLMFKGVNKGNAIKRIQKIKQISFAETMVFGDMMNDYEMMLQGYYSFAMANAIEDIKAVSRFQAESNDHNGVIKVLQKFFPL